MLSDHGFRNADIQRAHGAVPKTERLRAWLTERIGDLDIVRVGRKLVLTPLVPVDDERMHAVIGSLTVGETGEPLFAAQPLAMWSRCYGIGVRRPILWWMAGVLLLSACVGTSPKDTAAVTDSAAAPEPSRDSLRLRWVKALPDETWERARAGLWWGLSHLGAVPPADETGVSVVESDPDSVVFDLDLMDLGLPDLAVPWMLEAVQPLRNSDEMLDVGGVDVGRFLMLTLYAPEVYYGATGACSTLAAWEGTHLDTAPLSHWVSASLLVADDRLIRFNGDVARVQNIALEVSEASHGQAMDVIDVLPNGQQRFAAYDEAGRLSAFSPAGGSPGKCMWCHEGAMQRGLADNVAVDEHMGHDDFVEQLDQMEARMQTVRLGAGSAVDFETYHVHTWSEGLVEWFLQAPVARLAREWQMSEEEVRDRVDDAGLSWSTNEEFPDVGDVLNRFDADALFSETQMSAYTPVSVSSSAREVHVDIEPERMGPCR